MKIAIIASYGKSLVQFRGQLIRDLVASGAEVIALAPAAESESAGAVEELGALFRGFHLNRASLNPFSDYKTYRSLHKVISEIQPDVVLNYTAKPMVYGSLAAAKVGVPRILSMVTGLGYAFSGTSVKHRVLKAIQTRLYKWAFKTNARVIFQNNDDRKLFEKLKIVRSDQTAVVNGSGIDVERFSQKPLPVDEPFTFLMIARLLREKGVLEYFEAANIVSKTSDSRDMRFVLVGGTDPNPGGLTEDMINEESGAVDWLGEQADVHGFLNRCHCYVLPSYREGTPRSTLEALATGRPVVTTDAVGCRETVIESENGYMVPVGDAHSLAGAMIKILSKPRAELLEMANTSRKLAENKFDVVKVNQMMLDHIFDR